MKSSTCIWFVPAVVFVYFVLWSVLYLEDDGVKPYRTFERSLEPSSKKLELQNKLSDDNRMLFQSILSMRKAKIFHPIKSEMSNNPPINAEIESREPMKVHMKPKHHKPINDKNSANQPITRCAVVVYMPRNVNYIYQFVTMLYGSWKFIKINNDKLFNKTTIAKLNTVDLLVFTDKRMFHELPNDCKILDFIDEENIHYGNTDTTSPTCWMIQQDFETDSKYKNLNSFIMFLRDDISQVLSPYDYVLRTDIDVFLTPAFYSYRPTLDVITGIGGYSNQFNQRRLMDIAEKLNLNHNGIHNIGSSWYGRTQAIIRISIQASNLTRYIYDNEFKPNQPGLESIDLVKNPNGKWPNWYKLTASMYGSELALNDGVRDFSFANFEHFDTTACNPNPVWTHYQLHAYHTDCEFNKARFMNIITEVATGTSIRHKQLMRKFKVYSTMTLDDVHNRNCTDYSTYIAWSSAGKYLDFQAILRVR